MIRLIANLRHRHSHPLAGRGPTMPRIAAMAAVAMLVSVHAHAAPPKDHDDPYVQNFARIAADDKFREHYDEWRRSFPLFDWHNNGCSGPARPTDYADDFYWSCVQHDFGYRNAKKVHRHDEATRNFIDLQLLEHTKRVCSHRAVLAKRRCYAVAIDFYNAVRGSGRNHF